MYLEHFHLREKPFNVTPDPHFLYMSPSHQEAFANLLYGVRERKGFIMVTGEVGTGKTTLLHNLMSSLDEDIQTVFVFHTGLDFTDLLEMIHHELNIPIAARTRAALMQSLNRYLITQLEDGRNVALIIDEAQNLSPEILENLRLLSNLETSKDKLLQIVLVGQLELEAKMALPELRQLGQRVSTQSRLQPLSPEESRAYILHRLSVAGALPGGTPIFSEEALGLLCHRAQGIPRQLNVLCDNALLVSYGEGDRLVKAQHVQEVMNDRLRKPKSPPKEGQVAGGAPVVSPPGGRHRALRAFGIVSGALAVAVLLYGAFQLGRSKVGRVPTDRVALSPRLESSFGSVPAGEIETTDAGLATTPAPDLDAPGEQTAAPTESPAMEETGRTDPFVAPSLPDRSEPTPAGLSPSPTLSRDLPAAHPAVALDDASSHRKAFWGAATRVELQSILDRCPRRAYTVSLGDHFNGVVFEQTGRKDIMVLALIERMNPHITDYDHIEPGWVIYLPDFEE